MNNKLFLFRMRTERPGLRTASAAAHFVSLLYGRFNQPNWKFVQM